MTRPQDVPRHSGEGRRIKSLMDEQDRQRQLRFDRLGSPLCYDDSV